MKISEKRIISTVVMLFCLIGLIYMSVYLKSITDYKRAVKETTFTNVDISHVPDGVYIGEYDVSVIFAKVEVTVENGEITNINILEHRNERGKAAEAVINKIIEEQNIDVDAVSGATNSSTVIKKAVENAFSARINKPSREHTL